MKTFSEKVAAAVKKIPKGEVRTYKEIARAVGRPDAARAVGTALRKNADKAVPCHRVIRSDGSLGGYNGLRGGKSKKEILKSEGFIG